MRRIPSIDGLRCISIFLVIYGHSKFSDSIGIANLGVKVFFIISAYLIIGILFKNVQNNNFSIKRFYFKRLIRTLPAFYTYLIFSTIFLMYINYFDFSQFWRSIIFLENYHPRGLWNNKQWFVGHSWSLAVEEQFYILVAIVFYLFNSKIINKKGLNRIFLLVIIIVPFIRIAYIYGQGVIPSLFLESTGRSFETVSDALAIGGIIYLNQNKIQSSKFFNYFSNKIYLCIILILITLCLRSNFIPIDLKFKLRLVYYFFGETIVNILIGLIILITVKYHDKSYLARILNNHIIIYIGMLSYSIYLWQQIWLYNWNIHILFKYFGIIITATSSYYLIEKPFLRLRDKLIKDDKIK
tara:strand:+ start:1100 stop:2161 length:1062 start_codon:yes stop_codon:yes gene_type:complete